MWNCGAPSLRSCNRQASPELRRVVETLQGQLSNSQAALAPTDNLCARAYDMFTSRAYVHQYTQHGLELDAFTEAFIHVEQTIQNYRGLGVLST